MEGSLPDHRALFAALPGWYLVLDARLRVVDATDAYLHLIGCTRHDCIGQPLPALAGGEPGQAAATLLDGVPMSLTRILAGGTVERMPPRAHGGRHWRPTNTAVRNETGGVALLVHALEDVTDEVARDEVLRQTERLQAMGTLAAGVVHEINNMMSTVVGVAQLVSVELRVDDPIREDVQEIIAAGMRAASVGREFLLVGRRQDVPAPVVDLTTVIGELEPTLRRLLGADRRLEVHAAQCAIAVRADRAQIEQILINLAANARDATTTDGLVEILCERVLVSAETRRTMQALDAAPGMFARLTVRDDGVGMSPELLARIRAPFVTTKLPGQGTGLGLYLTVDIVRRRGGWLEIDSTPGMGTSVIILLPAAECPIAAPPASPPPGRGRGETVLVVEDEPLVRTLVRRILEQTGYDVIEAASGADALAILAREELPLSLVVTDVVMPHVKALDITALLAGRRSVVPVLFMSGYGRDYLQRRGLLAQHLPYIQKPFSPDMLVAEVHRLLAEQSHASNIQR